MRVFWLLLDEPFYTPDCLRPVLARWQAESVGAAFPPGFVGGRRLVTMLLLEGPARFLVRAISTLRARWRGGAVANVLRQLGIPIVPVRDVNDRMFLARLRALKVDVVMSLNCSQRVRAPLLTLPAYGVLNVHFGALPKYRGLFPVFHAVVNGERSFGVTVHRMDERLDNGPILLQEFVPIDDRATLDTLYRRGFETSGWMLDRVLAAIARELPVEERVNSIEARTVYSYPTWEAIRRYHRLMRARRQQARDLAALAKEPA